MRQCKKCKNFKEESDFYKNSRLYSLYCKECKEITLKENKIRKNEVRKLKLRTDPIYNAIRLKQRKDSRIRNYEKFLLNHAKSRARKLKIEFNLELNDIIIPEICPILEIPLKRSDINSTNNSPSLDRINNSKGYIKGNIRIISLLANRMKNNASMEQLKIFAKNILKYLQDDIV